MPKKCFILFDSFSFYFLLFCLTFNIVDFFAGISPHMLCPLRCDGVRSDLLPTEVFMFYMLFKYTCHLHMSFLNVFFVAICLFNILSWPRKKGWLRSADARWSFRTPPAARRLGGAAAYISYLVISK